MMTLITRHSLSAAIVLLATAAYSRGEAGLIPLDASTKLSLTNTRAIPMKYRGRAALHLAPDNASAFKGFVGISFRVHGDTAERFYIRPENARLDDQLFRNRSAQYEADPAFPWNRLRQEAPGTYESYVDLAPGAWTHLRIDVAGTKARLYVNGATQPALVVNDLKNGVSRGKIALWTRISSDAYFANLRVESK
ncbi:MAG TPA: hypothetical protein VI259_11250 [Gemmatimonadaceae bacterium]